MTLPLPVPHQDSARAEPSGPARPLLLAKLHHQCFEKARGRAIEFAIGIFLDLIGNAPAQEIGSKGLGRIGFELRAPERAKFVSQYFIGLCLKFEIFDCASPLSSGSCLVATPVKGEK